MFDETELNPQLAKFAESLRQTKPPEANVNRDQLMYDAGYAAAMAQRDSTAATSPRNIWSLAGTFASGIAVATAILLMVNRGPIPQPVENQITASLPVTSVAPTIANSYSDANRETEVDLLEWISNVPAGHSLVAGFRSHPTTPELAQADSLGTKNDLPPQRNVLNSMQLMRRLAPETRQTTLLPAWTRWVPSGG